MRYGLLALVILFLTACGTAKTVVLETPSSSQRFASVEIIADNPTVNVPPEITTVFEDELKTQLFESGKFAPGNALSLHYTFVSHDSGSRLARWFWGGIGNAGEATVTVLVKYLDENKKEVAKTQVDGRIGSGFFGGSINSAVKKSAQDVAQYTIDNFSN